MSHLRCSECGGLLPGGLDALCPRCLWADSMESGGSSLLPGHAMGPELARGGMGIVYSAQQFSPARVVAVKMLRPHLLEQTAMKERFRQEAQAAAALQHPGILPVYQVGESDGVPWFTMMLAEGGTLAARRDRYTGHWRDSASLIASLARAVGFAHERGVLHRDLKPGNILFDSADRAYVCDFGLAKVATAGDTTPDLTQSIQLLGTPHYMPPEVAGGTLRQTTTAGDIYSLGVILYELLAGRVPFDAENVPALLRRITDEDPPSLSKPVPVPVPVPVPCPPVARRSETGSHPPAGGSTFRDANSAPAPEKVPAGAGMVKPVSERQATGAQVTGAPPADLAAIAMKCLEKSPARRYSTAIAVAVDLECWLAGKPVSARSLTRLQKFGRWVRRNPAVAALSALLAAAVAGGVLYGGYRQVELRHALADTRLSEANYRRRADRPGRQTESLDDIRATIGISDPVKVRTSLAAAMAVSDISLLRQWPVHLANLETQFAFTSDLSRHAVTLPERGWAIIDTAGGQRIRTFPPRPEAHEMILRFSPDDRWLAVSWSDGRVEFFDLSAPGRPPFAVQRADGKVARFTFAPDSSQCFVLTGLTEAAILSLADGKVESFPFPVLPASGATEEWLPSVNGAAWSPDGNLIAIVRDQAFQILRRKDQSVLHSSIQPQWLDATVVWSPNGEKVVFRDLMGSMLQIYDLKKERLGVLPTAHHGKIRSFVFHPDGRTIATAGWDGRVVLTDVESNPRTPLQVPAATATLRFSADGTRLACAPDNTHAAIYQLIPSPVFRRWPDPRLGPGTGIFGVSVSPDGRWLATGESEAVRFYATSSGHEMGQVTRPFTEWWRAAIFSKDGQSLITSAFQQGVHRIPLTEQAGVLITGEPVPMGDDLMITPQEFTSDGKTLILATNRTSAASQNGRPNGEVALWPDADPARAHLLIPPQVPMVGFRAIPGTRYGLSTALLDPDVRIWDMETGQQVRTLGLAEKASTDISRDGRHIAVAHGGNYSIWDTATWQECSRWPAPNLGAAARVPFFTPDGRLVLTPAGNDGEFDLRSVPEGRLIATLIPPAVVFSHLVNFSPDSRHVYISTDTRQIVEWDLGRIREEWTRAGVPETLH